MQHGRGYCSRSPHGRMTSSGSRPTGQPQSEGLKSPARTSPKAGSGSNSPIRNSDGAQPRSLKTAQCAKSQCT
jgi:hypothetical protein